MPAPAVALCLKPIALLSALIVPSKFCARMVDYNSPATILADYTAMMKLYHVMFGIFCWELVTTLDFEWDFIRGRHPYRWTIWVYTAVRWTLLISILDCLMVWDVTGPINCQAWITLGLVSGYAAYAGSSLLILLRVIAIWNKNKFVIGIGMIILLTDIGFQINGIVRVRASWSFEAKGCVVVNEEATTPTILINLITDVTLLLIMLIGLLRMRLNTGGAFSLGRVLWKQGLIWLLIATSVEVPSTTLLFLNMNVPLSIIFQLPSNIIVAIAATRMYRLLVIFGSCSLEASGGKGRTAVSEMRVHSGPIPLRRMEVSVLTESEHYPTSQIGRTGSLIITDPQGHGKTHDVRLDVDVESGTGTEK